MPRAVSSCCSNTLVPNKCMIPLHQLLRHVGCHSSRRPESPSGRIFVIRSGDFYFLPQLWAPLAIRARRPLRSLHTHLPVFPQPDRHPMQKAQYMPPALSPPCGRCSRVPCYLSRFPYLFTLVTDLAQSVPILKTWKLTLAYDGTEFSGWQRSP